jgi:hypothetical protein
MRARDGLSFGKGCSPFPKVTNQPWIEDKREFKPTP